ncbi:hypothetical protein BDY19DRAFT_949151 [Irpex rosettiformis]|uniref:Uncharacterized protein n=1 Tax=Irpex rosettiformis TaxID=378272 RepID=A0ACB8U318_9APHY|nr:hypothetical protein BDY19DRAFT_949151 [Irpex rosettiformis]
MSLIGFAVENLDQVVSIVDGLVEIHPMCKVAWMVLGSVYKAFKDQHALDQQSRELAQELKETLAYAKECRDLEAIPEATDVLLEIAKLVVQSAAAFDAHMKYSVTTRALMSAATKASQNRILDCDQRLKVLRKKLQETLTIRIFQGQNALLAHNGLRDNGSSRSLPKERSLQPKYVPLPGKHRAGYSPVYLSRPIDEPSEQIRQSPPASHLFLPPDDGLRRFTSSPEPMDSHMFMPPPSLRTFGQSSMPDPYSPIEPTWSPWPMSSRTVSFTTDSGRTLSSKSSCSSLSEPCDCPHSEPEIYDPDAENLEETIVGGRSTPASDIQAPNTIPQSRAPRNVDFGISPQKHQAHALPTALPLAMPIPMSWSQRSL